ncbi:unnamed protein product [Symbiodinium sp. CCMP2592]|nr:unnamed protein product [Symbiodinium sp. CCMP2592]
MAETRSPLCRSPSRSPLCRSPSRSPLCRSPSTPQEPKQVAWEPVSAGARHTARLLYYPYQTVVGTLKIYVAVEWLQDTNTELFWPSVAICLILIPFGMVAAYLSRDSLSDIAFDMFEDPRSSNKLMKTQVYGIFAMHMMPVLLLASPQAVAQTLVFNALGFFMVLTPLLDDAQVLISIFCSFSVVGVARSCAGDVSLSKAICFGAGCNVTEGIGVRLLLRFFDSGFRQHVPRAREILRQERLLVGASPYALQVLQDLTRKREGTSSFRQFSGLLRRRLDRREQAVAQFLFLHHCAVHKGLEHRALVCILDFVEGETELPTAVGL